MPMALVDEMRVYETGAMLVNAGASALVASVASAVYLCLATLYRSTS